MKSRYHVFTVIALLPLLLCTGVSAQKYHVGLPTDTTVVTQHDVTINGQNIDYRAESGMQPVYDDDGSTIASLHYTYYTRTGVDDISRRPLLISFNGGPGSGSVWMHLAYTGPRILNIDDEGYPVQPYGVRENPFSVLDATDILYVNPVNTGYSRTVPLDGEGVDRDKFFGVNADIAYLAEWLNVFVTRHDRWLSPKYLIGESYGGTRVAGLSYALQNSQWMYLNGVIMVSPADYKILRTGGPVDAALNLPYFAATAWHHGQLGGELQGKELEEMLPEVEAFTVNEYIPALSRGGGLPTEERRRMAERVATYTGLNAEAVLDQNLRIPTAWFWKNLLNDEEYTIGRLDSRYLGLDKQNLGTSPDFSAELTTWLHAFTPAINHYLNNELELDTDRKYNMFGSVYPWDDSDDNTRDQLRMAMAMNPYLNVMWQSGYYDGATTYFHAKHSMGQLDPSGKLRDRMNFKGYRSGHMMYLRRADLEQANNDVRDFIERTTTGGRAARYELGRGR